MKNSKALTVMSKSNIVFMLAAGWLLAAIPVQSQTAKEQEQQAIAVLKSDAGHKEKADACRQLGVVGTKEAVPVLAGLLGDEKLSHMARYGLEPIPDPAVDEALRAALDKLSGLPLVGVIGSVGVRRDAAAVTQLTAFLNDANPEVAQAAARALGKIGDAAAAKAIDAMLTKTPAANRLAFCEGLLRCAEALADAGNQSEALKIYLRLSAVSDAPHQVRAGALRGAVLTQGNDGIPLLVKGVRSDDYILTAAAARTAMEMSGPEVTKALAAELPKLPPDKQILIAQTLGKRGDVDGLDALVGVAKAGDKRVRVAAIKCIPEIAHPSAVPTLVALLNDQEREVVQAAQDALGAFPGAAADAAVLAMIGSGSADLSVTGMELAARRRMKTAIPALTTAASHTDAKVRVAALRKLGELGGPGELPILLNLLARNTGGQELGALEQGLSAICIASGDADGSAEKLTAAMAGAQAAQKCALIRVLGAVGGSKGLAAVGAAVGDADPEVHSTAIRTLGDWKSAEAATLLLDLAKKTTKLTDKVLALRSYLKIASSQDLRSPERLAMCKAAAGLIERDDEKKLLLGVLGGINSWEAVELAAAHLDNNATKAEACAAVVGAAERVLKSRPNAQTAGKLVQPLEKAAQATGNDGQKQKAQELLRQARSVK